MATAIDQASNAGLRADAKATRARILDHARRQFCKFGYDRFNVSRLAFICGCSINTIHRQIGDRDDLYAETVTTLVNELALHFTIDLSAKMELPDAVHFYYILLLDLHRDQRMRDLRKIMVIDGQSQALLQQRYDRLIRRPIADAFEKYLLGRFAGQFAAEDAPAFATKMLWDLAAIQVDNEPEAVGDDLPTQAQVDAATQKVRAALFASNQP